MKRPIYIFGILICLALLSCTETKIENKNAEVKKSLSTDLAVDHLNVWVEDPIMAKNKLVDIGFIAVPDSLSMVHKGQGTTGRYFYFLNGYLAKRIGRK